LNIYSRFFQSSAWYKSGDTITMTSIVKPNRPCAALGHAWQWPGNSEPFLTLEVFIDYCCPFSARIFTKLTEEVIPHYNTTETPSAIKLIFQQIPQPWHPQSATMHESVLAVRHLYGIEKTNEYQALLMAAREDFTDYRCCNETRMQTSSRLAELAGTLDGIDAKDVMVRLTPVFSETSKNSGSPSIRVLKFYVKQHRQLGIHVSPTCRINGMVVDTSSGWTLKQWNEFLDPMIQLASSGYKRN
jgi:hypothetical protein